MGHHEKRVDEKIRKHIEQKQFWCPKAFDLSIYGEHDDVESKTLILRVRSIKGDEVIEGKHLLVLMNNQRVVYGAESS